MIEAINDMKSKKRKQVDTGNQRSHFDCNIVLDLPRRSVLLQLFTESGAEKVKSSVKMIDEILQDDLSGKVRVHHSE